MTEMIYDVLSEAIQKIRQCQKDEPEIVGKYAFIDELIASIENARGWLDMRPPEENPKITHDEFDAANRRAKEGASNAQPAFWNHVLAAACAMKEADDFDLQDDDRKSKVKYGLLCRQEALEALALVQYVKTFEFELVNEFLAEIDSQCLPSPLLPELRFP